MLLISGGHIESWQECMSLLSFFIKVEYNLERRVASPWVYGHLYFFPCNPPFVTFHYTLSNGVWGYFCLVKDFCHTFFPIIETSVEGLQGEMQSATVDIHRLTMWSIIFVLICKVI